MSRAESIAVQANNQLLDAEILSPYLLDAYANATAAGANTTRRGTRLVSPAPRLRSAVCAARTAIATIASMRPAAAAGSDVYT